MCHIKDRNKNATEAFDSCTLGTGIIQSVLHSKFYFDDVFIFREHGGFAKAGGFDHVVTANVDRSNLGDKNQLMFLNWIGKTPIKTRSYRYLVFAKLGNDSLLAFLHNEEAGAQPN